MICRQKKIEKGKWIVYNDKFWYGIPAYTSTFGALSTLQ
jgi:hypothetical protein